METSITLQVCLDLVERKMESSQKGIRLKKVCRRSHFPSELLSREGHDSECLKRTCEMEKDSELQGDKSPKEPFIGVPIEQVEAKENPEMQGEKIAFAVPELSNSGANHEVDTICVANRHFQGEAKKKSAVRSAAPDFVIATNFSSSLSGHDDDRKKTKKKKRKVWSQRTRRRKRAKIVKLSAVPEKMTAVSNVEADVFHKSFIEGEEDSRARNNVACTTEDIQNPVLCLSDDENETNKVQEVAKADVTSELLERGSEEPQSTRTNSIVAGKFAYPSRDDPEAVEVLVSDLERLEDFVFLNDTVIDFYIMYVQREHKWPNDLKDRLHFYNSFFYKKLHEAVQSQKKEKNDRKMHNLRKWTKGINIFEKSYLFFPIHDKCVIEELRQLGESFSGTLLAARRFDIAKCNHEPSKSASDCLLAMVGEKNSEHFFIGTQDVELRKRLRKAPGVALIFAKKNSVFLEPPSEWQQKFARLSESERLHMKEEELRIIASREMKKKAQLAQNLDGSHGETENAAVQDQANTVVLQDENLKQNKRLSIKERPVFKRKRAKGPNPLSCQKKQKKSVQSLGHGSQITRTTPSKRTRARHKKQRNHLEGSVS